LFLPLSRLITQLDLKDSLWALILVYPSFTVPFATWLLMGFLKTIPGELEEAALMDGASRLKALYLIVLPISLPGILTAIIFAFSLCVNEFITRSFVSSSEQRTVSAGIPNDLIRGDVFFWQSLLAATLIPRSARAPLQRVPRPLHQGLYRRRVQVENRLRRKEVPCGGSPTSSPRRARR
jgi:multiple sugar transport system permease protein